MNLICLLKNRDYECIIYILKNMETITKSFQANKQNNGQLILPLYLFSSDNVETKQANKIYEYFTKLFDDLRMQTENHASYDETTEQKRCQAAVHLHLPSIQCRLLCGHVHELIARQALTSEQAVKQSEFQLDSCKFDFYSKCRLLSCCNETQFDNSLHERVLVNLDYSKLFIIYACFMIYSKEEDFKIIAQSS